MKKKHGRPAGMTNDKIAERNDRIFKDVNKEISFSKICEKYGVSMPYLKTLIRSEEKKEREILKEAVEPRAEEDAIRHAAELAKIPANEQNAPVDVQVQVPEPAIPGTPIKKLGKIFITIDVQYEAVE